MLHVEDAAQNFPLRTVLGPMTSDSQNDRTFTALIRSVSRGIPWRGADIMLRKPVSVAGVARALADAAALDRRAARSEAA